jgi:hypothetical protein
MSSFGGHAKSSVISMRHSTIFQVSAISRICLLYPQEILFESAPMLTYRILCLYMHGALSIMDCPIHTLWVT